MGRTAPAQRVTGVETVERRLPALAQVTIPRWYTKRIKYSMLPAKERVAKEMQLHCFVDASAIGYGAVSYICAPYRDGTVSCAFVWENLVLHLFTR